MIPCSMKQIVEEARLRQQNALAAAERERRAVCALRSAPEKSAAQRRGRAPRAPLTLATARQAGRSLVAAVGAVVRPRGAHP